MLDSSDGGDEDGAWRELARDALTQRLESAAVDEIGEALEEAIAVAAQVSGADLAWLFEVRGAEIVAVASAGDLRSEDLSRWPRTVNEAVVRIPWLANRFVAGETVHLPLVADLPDEALPERRMFGESDIEALLALPLLADGEIVAIVVFECIGRSGGWSDSEIEEMERFAGLFATALGRRRLEDAQSETENRFKALTENAAELICELDVFGRYRYVSRSYTDLLGYEAEELIGKASSEIVHPDDMEGSVERFVDALQGLGDSCIVQRLRHRDGSWRWFDNTGRAYKSASGELRFVSIGRDITERKLMEEALERNLVLEAHVARISRSLLDADETRVADTITAALAETGELVGADRGYFVSHLDPGEEECFVYNLEERPDEHPMTRAWVIRKIGNAEIFHSPDLQELPPYVREGFEERGVRAVIGIPITAGGEFAAFLTFERTRTSGAFAEEQVTALDVIGQLFVSALRRCAAAQELRTSHMQLVQSQKIEAVGRLAGGIAHDFNNLLTVILGFARPMLSELSPGEEMHEDVQQICGAAERAANLTSRLLAFSRGQAHSSQQVDLNKVVSELSEMLQRLLEEDIELSLELCDDECLFEGDANALEQVLVNLSVNARDAMPEGGDLRIRTRRAELDAYQQRCLGMRRKDAEGSAAFVVLEVEDFGSGMAKPVRQHLFEPFFTTKEVGKGTGLGLSIVYSVVKDAKGAISVASQEGKGSVFTIYLPEIQSSEQAQAVSPKQRATRGDETLLLVEDETAVRQLVRRTLEGAGYRVVVAKNGEDALGALTADRRIDGLVTDVVMPRMGGVELARRLRLERPSLPVLYISGYAPERIESTEDAAEVASGFLGKPFSASQLLDRVRGALDGVDP